MHNDRTPMNHRNALFQHEKSAVGRIVQSEFAAQSAQ